MTQRVRLLALVALMFIPGFIKAQVAVNYGGTPRTGCSPLYVQFHDSTVAPTGDSLAYYWTFVRDSAGTVDSFTAIGAFPRPEFVSGGTFNVTEKVVAYSGGVAVDSGSKTQMNYVYVNRALNVNFKTLSPGDTFACIGSVVRFVNTSDSVLGCSQIYNWRISHIPTTGLSEVTDTTFTTNSLKDTVGYRFHGDFSYNMTLFVTSACSGSCGGAMVKYNYITIDTFPVASFTDLGTYCAAPINVSFTNNSSGAGGYFWRFGDGTTSFLASPTHNYTASGSYTDTLIAYSPLAGCANSTTLPLTIQSKVFGFTISNSAGIAQTVFCSGDTIMVKDTTSLPGTKGDQWVCGGYSSANTDSSVFNSVGSFNVLSAGTYIMYDSSYNNAGCYGVTRKSITVNPLPTVSITPGVFQYRPAPNDTVSFSALVTTATSPLSYVWFFGDTSSTVTYASDTSHHISPTHIYSTTPAATAFGPGSYNPQVTVTDAHGCSTNQVFNGFVTIGKPLLNITTSVDSGCAPIPFNYTTSTSPIGAITVSYAIDSITFSNGDSTRHHPAHSETDTLRIGDYTDTLNFHYHVTRTTLSPASDSFTTIYPFDTAIVIHVGGVHTSMSGVTFSDTVCPNTLINFMAGVDSTIPGLSFRWNFGFGGPAIYHYRFDTAVTYSTPGKYHIIAIASLNGCNDTLQAPNDTVHVLPPGSASIAITQPNCSNLLTYNFVGGTVTGTPGVYTHYSWDFGDGTHTVSDSGRGVPTPIVHPFASQGNYTVTLTDSVMNGYGCKNIDTVTIKIWSFTDFNDSMLVSNPVICKGIVDTFFGPIAYAGSLPSYKYSQYSWHWGDGSAITSSTTSNIATHAYASAGNYIDTVIIKTPYGCYDSVYYANELVNSTGTQILPYVRVGGPTISISATPIMGADPLTVVFTDATSDSFAITNRRWNLNSSPSLPGVSVTQDTVISSNMLTYTFPEGALPTGKFNIQLIDTDAVGCHSAGTTAIYSQKLHTYFTIAQRTDVSGCMGLPYQFSDTSSFCTYVWHFGDGTTGTGQNPTHAYTAVGTYTVSVTATSISGGYLIPGLTSTYTDTTDIIHVDSMHVSFTLSDTFANCPPIFEIGTNTTAPPYGGYEFYWYVSPVGGLVDSSSIPSNLYTTVYTPGTTSAISLVAVNPIGCRDSVVQTVHINGPAGKIVLSAPTGCAPLLGEVLSFVDTNGTDGSVSNVTWYTGDGSTYTGSESITHSYYTIGTYHPYVTVDGAGCTSVVIPATTIVVNQLADSIIMPSKICFGTSTTLWAAGADSGGSYQWIPATGLSCNTCGTVTANPTTTTTYRVVVTTLAGCFDTLTTTLPVDDSLYAMITGSAAGNSFCQYQTDTLMGSGSFGTMMWSPSGILSCTTCDTVIAAPPASTMVYFTITDSVNCVARDSVSLTVRMLPLFASSTTDTVCNNAPLVYVPMSNDTTATFSWSRAAVANISNAAGSGVDTIMETLHDTTYNTVSVAYVYTMTAAGCSSDTTIMVTVHPTPSIALPLLDSVCSLAPLMYVDSSTVAGTTYSWMRDSMGFILPTTNSGTGNIMETLTNTDTIPHATQYYITLTANNCMGYDTLTVNVNPTPILISSHNLGVYCRQDTVNYIAESSMPGASMTWSRGTVTGLGSGAASGMNGISETLSDTGNSTIEVAYTYTVSAHGCTSDTNMVNLKLRPNVVLKNALSDTLCSGNVFTFNPSTNCMDALTYNWSHLSLSGVSVGAGTSGSGGIMDTVSTTTTFPTLTKFAYVINDSGCMYFDTVKLLVSHPPAATAITSEVVPGVICMGTMSQLFSATVTPDAGNPYTWSTKNGNATIESVGSTSQYCLVNFSTAGVDTIIISAGIGGSSGCGAVGSKFPITIDGASAATAPVVIYFEHNLYCLENDDQGYQWGMEDKHTLQDTMLLGQTYQNLYAPTLDTANYYYFVETWKNNNCMQRSYFTNPALGVATIGSSFNGSLFVYPNPAASVLNAEVKIGTASSVKFVISNLLGQHLIVSEAVGNKSAIDINQLPDGAYLIEGFVDGLKIGSTMFVKN